MGDGLTVDGKPSSGSLARRARHRPPTEPDSPVTSRSVAEGVTMAMSLPTVTLPSNLSSRSATGVFFDRNPDLLERKVSTNLLGQREVMTCDLGDDVVRLPHSETEVVVAG